MQQATAEKLKNPFRDTDRFMSVRLVDGEDRVELTDLRRMQAGAADSGWASVFFMDMQNAWNSYVALPAMKGRTELVFSDIAKIAGMSEPNTERLIGLKILLPSRGGGTGSGRGKQTRIFSIHDGFIAGTVGSLNRRGLTQKTLLAVADHLREFFSGGK